ncbi:putative Queuine tRNA-ribosyltransferase-like protein [Stipitochalara longipes BDJ]|nr:putative Queuine tRNA-ribosyltransferase-like protein [Stipitochalara longipes BDJ]
MAATNGFPIAGRKIAFEILSHLDANVAGPRLGRLSIQGRRDIETPNFFAVTSRGVIPHLTPDVVSSHTQIGGVHMALEDFIERAMSGTPPMMNCPGPSPLHTFTALPKSLPSLLAPRRTPAVSAPNGNSNSAISIFTSTGFQVLSNKSYISYIENLRPDIAIALADIPYGALPGTKRVAKMGDRTQEWLSQLLNEKRDEQVVFAPVLPIDYLDQSEYLNNIADELADEVSGLAFYDSNLLPDIPATTAIAKLPRLSLDEPSSPRQILRQISLGMDVFTVPFTGFATDAGIALTFRFPRPLPTGVAISNGVGALQLGVDMWPAVHSTSVNPLDTSCTCYTCTSHHRAYVQHLLSAKEMLGWVLLQVHNHHILSEFFTAIRESIRDETFDADCEEFAKIYESELPEKSGQGPRVRGYHFKSEGPSEPKKNRAAWGNLGGDDQDVSGGLVPDEPATELEEKGFA